MGISSCSPRDGAFAYTTGTGTPREGMYVLQEREEGREGERERARDFIALDLSMLEARWVESFDTLQRTGWGIGGAEGKSKHTRRKVYIQRFTYSTCKARHVCKTSAHAYRGKALFLTFCSGGSSTVAHPGPMPSDTN